MLRVLILLLCWPAWANAIIMPSPEDSERNIGADVEVLLDAEGSWRIDDVSGRFARRFMPSSRPMPNFGFTESAIWFRFTLDFSQVHDQTWYLLQSFPLIDHLTLYEGQSIGGFRSITMGDTLPFDQRIIAHRGFIFPLDTSTGDVRTYYLRASGKGALSFELTLISAQGMIERSYQEQMLFGLFFGAVLAILIYNLLSYFSLRDSNYLYFVAFLAMLALHLFSMNGFALQYLWPHWPVINSGYLFFAYFGMAALIGYSQRFLDLSQRMPAMAKISRWLFWMYILLAAVTFWIDPPGSFYINIVTVLLTLLFLMVIGLLSWLRGYRAARLYLLAWSVFFLALIVFALDNLGLIPHTLLGNYAPHISGIWVAMLLSLALADRIKLIERQRRQQAALAEQVLHQQIEAAAALDCHQRTFLDYLSHELQTPLNWLGQAKTLNRDRLPAELSEVVVMVQQGQQRLQQLIGTSLRYFDLLGSRQPPSMAHCQPALLIHSLQQTFAEHLAEKQLTLINRLPERLHVLACQKLLREVLGMLLDNAIRLSPVGGDIEISAVTEEDSAILRLRDQGCGLTAEQQERIFQPFFMVGSEHQTDGFGLSLAMARVMVEQMSGTIWARSSGVDRGASFYIRLPLAEISHEYL